jgi:hypothetical protein
MKWAGHVVRMEKMRNANTFSYGNMNGKDNFAHISIYGRIILRWILKK